MGYRCLRLENVKSELNKTKITEDLVSRIAQCMAELMRNSPPAEKDPGEHGVHGALPEDADRSAEILALRQTCQDGDR
jgi:hypothetical protein